MYLLLFAIGRVLMMLSKLKTPGMSAQADVQKQSKAGQMLTEPDKTPQVASSGSRQ
jgi:hypothetical protein